MNQLRLSGNDYGKDPNGYPKGWSTFSNAVVRDIMTITAALVPNENTAHRDLNCLVPIARVQISPYLTRYFDTPSDRMTNDGQFYHCQETGLSFVTGREFAANWKTRADFHASFGFPPPSPYPPILENNPIIFPRQTRNCVEFLKLLETGEFVQKPHEKLETAILSCTRAEEWRDALMKKEIENWHMKSSSWSWMSRIPLVGLLPLSSEIRLSFSETGVEHGFIPPQLGIRPERTCQ